ncbi:hypothetical protein GW796_07975 [archaeon]|nr:hypothetical protein [archaeon]
MTSLCAYENYQPANLTINDKLAIYPTIKPSSYVKYSKEVNKYAIHMYFCIEDLIKLVNLSQLDIDNLYYLNLDIQNIHMVNNNLHLTINNTHIIIDNLREQIMIRIKNKDLVFYFFTDNQKLLYILNLN